VGPATEELARTIARQLRAHGHSAYLVGGCVRDLLLHIPPKDFDVATSARPHDVLALYPRAQLVGVSFGVVLVREGDATVEVATYRSDLEYHDGRRPSHVTFETEPKQDVLRRDFTINGLLLDPDSDEVIDFVGGRRDLDLGLVRAIGDAEKRFREDHLRLLRAVRFAARLNFDIESETEAAIVRLHPLARDIAPERVRDEFVRILTEGAARRGLELLERLGLLNDILVPLDKDTMTLFEKLENPTSTLAMAVLLRDYARQVRDFMTRLRFSNEEIRTVEALVGNYARLHDMPRMKDSALKRIMRMPRLDELLALAQLVSPDVYGFLKRKHEEFGPQGINPPRLLSGDDLLALGIPPGPRIGRVLDAVEDAQLDGEIRTRDEAIAFATKMRASGPAST
jgi:poly(A) polymerase